MEIYIIRHGQTVWNKEGKLQGATDIMLNEEGIKIAKETGIGMKDIPFDKIYSSPLTRAYDTACYIRGDRDIDIVKDDRIREICFGSLEGKIFEEMLPEEKSRCNIFFQRPHLYVPDEKGETLNQLLERGAGFMRDEIENKEKIYNRIMIIAHGAMNKALMTYIKGNSPDEFWEGPVQKNCNVIIVRLENGKYEVIEEKKTFY